VWRVAVLHSFKTERERERKKKMKKFTLKKETRSVYEGFEFELGGKLYKKDVIDQELFDVLTNMEEGSNDVQPFARALLGEEVYEQDKPFNVLELLALLKWVNDEILMPFLSSLGDNKPKKSVEKNESEK